MIMEYIKQITKVYKEKKLVLETEEDVPVNKIKHRSFIRLNNEFEVEVNTNETVLTETKIIQRLSFIMEKGKFPDDISMLIELYRRCDLEGKDNIRMSLKSTNFPFDTKTLEDITTIRNLFMPVLMDQISTTEFSKLYHEEHQLYHRIQDEREKILKKEERDKARAIASAQLQKERQKPRTETPRKR
jgi:hypothetical protein